MKKRNFPLYKIFVYVALITLAISIIVPIAWVFLASLKSQLELVSGNPFDFPKQMLWSNFADAFVKARMGDYLVNTIIVTALSLVILLVSSSAARSAANTASSEPNFSISRCAIGFVSCRGTA